MTKLTVAFYNLANMPEQQNTSSIFES